MTMFTLLVPPGSRMNESEIQVSLESVVNQGLPQ